MHTYIHAHMQTYTYTHANTHKSVLTKEFGIFLVRLSLILYEGYFVPCLMGIIAIIYFMKKKSIKITSILYSILTFIPKTLFGIIPTSLRFYGAPFVRLYVSVVDFVLTINDSIKIKKEQQQQQQQQQVSYFKMQLKQKLMQKLKELVSNISG